MRSVSTSCSTTTSDSATLFEVGTLSVPYKLSCNRERARPTGLRAVSSWSTFAGLITELERG
jgi:hypothetical protein